MTQLEDMNIDRRSFIKSTVTTSAAFMLSPEIQSLQNEKVTIPAGLAIRIMATNWGFDGTVDQFCAKAKQAGYDGVEIVFPADEKSRAELNDAVKKYSLEVAFLIQTSGDDAATHLKALEQTLTPAAAAKPLYINLHAGRDHFSMEQNLPLMQLSAKIHQSSKIPIYHETHRGRILYAAPIAKNYLDKVPDLRLTLDISHWCAVHESLLGDQATTIEQALKSTDHIHARIGHPEGPQVNDPRAPEWTEALNAHLAWWDRVVKYKIAAGAPMMTFLTEFGPVDYMPAVPYTRQPVANQWDINVFMLQLLRKRYAS